MNDPSALIDGWRDRFEDTLAEAVRSRPGAPQRLLDAMHYAVLDGGKRIRPLLVYATGHALGLPPRALDRIACAIEVIHAYSLIHDDLPSMDDDDLRRGRPTCHRAFDEATAILAGDALQALAFELLAADPQLSLQPERQARIICALAIACGATGMAGGQSLDLAAIGENLDLEALTRMHQLKTGALIKVCATAPGLLAGASPDLIAKLEQYGDAVGLAFQIYDDILDVTGTAEQIGKSTQKDARLDKPTFPGLLGLHESRREATRLRDLAIALLEDMSGDCEPMRYLATVAIERDH